MQTAFSVRATLTLLTGYIFSLSDEDILSFTLSEGVTGGNMLLGGALAAHCSLSLASPAGAWLPGGDKLGARTLPGAAVLVEISENGGGFFPAARFLVSEITSEESEDQVTLHGYDDMAHALSSVFTDTLSYPQPLSALLVQIASQSNLPLTGTPVCNAGLMLQKRPAWGNACTLRQALSWVCALCGCFARVTPQGELALLPVHPDDSFALSAGHMYALSLSCAPFALNRVRLCDFYEKASPVSAALNEALPASAADTLELKDNPLLAPAVCDLSLIHI